MGTVAPRTMRGFRLTLTGRAAGEALAQGVGQRIQVWLGYGYAAIEPSAEGGFIIADLVAVHDLRAGGAVIAAEVRIARQPGERHGQRESEHDDL